MDSKKDVIVLDPSNAKHQAFVRTFMAARTAPVLIHAATGDVVARDSLVLADKKPQKVLTDADLENIRAAEEKRARKAAKLR